MHYRGRLSVPDQPGSGLRVDLEVKDRHLLVSTGGENLGTYPLSQTLVERVTGDRFRLTIGNEVLEFAADDALGFSYEAMPAMSGSPTHGPRSWREFWRRNRPTPTGGMMPTSRPVSMESAPDNGHVEPVEPEERSTESVAGGARAAEAGADVGFADLTLDHKVAGDPLEPGVSEPVRADPPGVGSPGTQEHESPPWESVDESSEQDLESDLEPLAGLPEPESDPETGSPTGTAGEAASGVESLDDFESEVADIDSLDTPGDRFDHEMWSSPVESQGGEECRGRRADGSPCGSVAINASGFCFAHDPDLAGERRLMTERVNQTARRARATDPDLEGLVVRLERAVADVQDGTLDPQQALAMASLVQAMCDTIGVNRRRD